MLTRDDIVSILDRLQPIVGSSALAALQIPERIIHRHTLSSYSVRAGLPYGQIQDRRYLLAGGRGLHEHRFSNGYSVFHVDTQDGAARPIQHLVRDTHALTGALVGSAGTVFGFGPVSVLVGLVLGARIPKRKLVAFSYDTAMQRLYASSSGS
jgi:hypothetical protein